MSKTSNTVKERAFWHWEYLRRNQHYQKWSNELPQLLKVREAHKSQLILTGDAYKKHQAQELDLLQEHAPTIFKTLNSSSQLTPNYIFFPAREFELQFKRLYKPHDKGIDVEKEFDALLNGDSPCFMSEEFADITGLICAYHQWIMRLDGETTTHSIRYKHIATIIELECDGFEFIPYEILALDLLKKATLETHLNYRSALYPQSNSRSETSESASKLIEDVEKRLNGDLAFKNSYAETVKELATGLKGVNAISTTRLTSLWMWEKANEINQENILKNFDDLYDMLCEKIDVNDLDSLTQFIDNPQRAKDCLLKTDECIRTMRILNFSPSKK